MTKDKDIYILLNQILDIDISFIVDDIVGNFTDPDIPVNVDSHNFSIDVDTPHGICTITISNTEDKKEVRFQRHVTDTFYEEYRLDLLPQSEYYFCVDGKTVELREKGFIINDIDKKYEFDEKKQEVTDIKRILKKQEVYLNRELEKLKFDKNNQNILEVLGCLDDQFETSSMNSEYTNTLAISRPCMYYSFYNIFPHVTIDGNDQSCMFRMNRGTNLIGRTFDLYEGIITKENYDDAISLARFDKFSFVFAYEDYKKNGESINSRIDDLIGSGVGNYKREYSKQVRETIESYYQHIINDSFLFKKNSTSPDDKLYEELYENNYIKQILLKNPDITDTKRSENNV